uniref:Uncharacterized protein n=1 Tax=Hucho hucho TaxID=62062 RepID=A0A4W5K8G6_9TELE
MRKTHFTAQGGGAPSDYLSDLIAFLCSTFSVFTHLPVSISHTHTFSCLHTPAGLVSHIHTPSLVFTHLPIKFQEWFARAGPVPGFQGDTLLLAFSDLRQVSLCFSLFYHSLSLFYWPLSIFSLSISLCCSRHLSLYIYLSAVLEHLSAVLEHLCLYISLCCSRASLCCFRASLSIYISLLF